MQSGRSAAPVVAIAGATGAVGIELLGCLERRNFPLSELRLFASARSAGKKLTACVARVIADHFKGGAA